MNVPSHSYPTLFSLIQEARSGKLRLPRFQRNFVWSAKDITELLVSILKEHYIGTFLLLGVYPGEEPFEMRSLQGITLDAVPERAERMILDGQQRLTSLNYVFYAPLINLRWTAHPYRFFIHLNHVRSGNLDACVEPIRFDRAERMLPYTEQFQTLLIPFTEIVQWSDWKKAYRRYLRENTLTEVLEAFEEHDEDIWDEAVKRLVSAQVTALTIEAVKPDDDEGLGQVCAIFEKMNTTGVKLSVYDLLTAKLYRHTSEDGQRLDLHSLWQQSQTHRTLNKLSGGKADDFGVYLLRTIALMRGTDVKSSTLINLPASGFSGYWRDAAKATEAALVRMTSRSTSGGFGGFASKWIPYSTMVVPMAAFLHKIDALQLDGRAYDLLSRWYWASVFSERYAGAVESVSHRDYQDLLRPFEPNRPAMPFTAIQDALQTVNSEQYSLQKESHANSVYRGVMCLIALNGALDFFKDDPIEFHDLEDHHIFPRAWLEDQKDANNKPLYNKDQINTILNRTLILAKTNNQIKAKSPRDYLCEIRNKLPESRVRAILASHFIDDDAREAMEANNYDAFLTAREKTLIAEIRRRLHGNNAQVQETADAL